MSYTGVMAPPRNEPDASRRSERARLAVLEATKQLIATVGYDNMSIDAIAAMAGVGKQTIYRWWRSKAAVVLDMWAPEVHPRIEFPDTGDLAADLKSQIKAVIDLGSDPTSSPFLQSTDRREPIRPSARRAATRADPSSPHRGLQRTIPHRASCQPLQGDIDLDLAVDMFYGGFYHRYLLRVAPLSHAYADAVVDAALNGIGPRPQRQSRTHSNPLMDREYYRLARRDPRANPVITAGCACIAQAVKYRERRELGSSSLT